MTYANVKPDRLLNLTFEKNTINQTVECKNIMDYLVDINRLDQHFKTAAIRDDVTLVIEYLILKDNKSIVKVYTSKGDVWVRQNYGGQYTGK